MSADDSIAASSATPGKGLARLRGIGDGQRIMRVFAYATASVLALLLITVTFPPLISDTSDRAVLNAPVSLLTAPIAGDVEAVAIAAGDRLPKGAPVMRITNDRVDRSTLIDLQIRLAELHEQARFMRMQEDDATGRMARLDTMIAAGHGAIITRLTQDVAQAREELKLAEIEAALGEQILERNRSLLSRKVISEDRMDEFEKQRRLAQGRKTGAEIALSKAETALQSAEQNIYLAGDLASMNDLIKDRRQARRDLRALQIGIMEAAAREASLGRLLDAEQRRIDLLSRAVVATVGESVVAGVSVAPGHSVTRGETLARTVDCNDAFVVAIFSQRQGQDLAVGKPVEVTADGWRGAHEGYVSQLLPHTTELVNQRYAVPFPPTERRELYALIKPGQGPGPSGGHGGDFCDVGKWVRVTLVGGLVPSPSVMLRSAGRVIETAAAAMIPPVSRGFHALVGLDWLEEPVLAAEPVLHTEPILVIKPALAADEPGLRRRNRSHGDR